MYEFHVMLRKDWFCKGKRYHDVGLHCRAVPPGADKSAKAGSKTAWLWSNGILDGRGAANEVDGGGVGGDAGWLCKCYGAGTIA
ncbi:hypothetical protein D9M73_287760 [compost metagenome]